MTSDELNVDKQGGVLTLTMNRPERRNAITTVMLAEMIYCLEQARSDPDVRVVVLRGAGAGFCPGFQSENFRHVGEGMAVIHQVDDLAHADYIFLTVQTMAFWCSLGFEQAIAPLPGA